MNKILLITLFTLSFHLQAQASDTALKSEVNNISTLSLTAEAIIYRPPDRLEMTIGAVTVGDTAETALTENSTKMEAIIKNLQDAGLETTEFETGRFNIRPNYSPYPKDPPPNWSPNIVSYEVTNTIFVHTDKIDSAGRLIDVANKAGANSVENIHFTIQNYRNFWNDAIHEATEHALADAQTLAEASGVKLNKIVSISLDNPNGQNPRPLGMYLAKMGSMDNAPPIHPGNITISASVSVVYEVTPK